MIRYRCEKDNIEVNTSVCPHCGQRAFPVQSELYWCSSCNIPTYEKECPLCHNEGKRVSADLRPVFPEERILLETISEQEEYTNQVIDLKDKSVWNGAGSIYYANGKRLGIQMGKLKGLNIGKIRLQYEKKVEQQLEEYKKTFEKEQEKFVKANEGHFYRIEQEAMEYIREIAEKYSIGDMMVSFSGGKDSTVVADLVTRTIGDGNKKVLHIFGDTTLEFPSTYAYVERYKKEHPKIPVVSSRNKEKDFGELCRLVGPPSRVMRWCCTIFKTGAITRKIEKLFRNKRHIITFYGVRRSESANRSKYSKETESPKIAKQTVVSPIIDWFDFDVWLYILSRKVDFNDAYRIGYARVGCWCCPNNSIWSEFLSKLHMPEQYQVFRDILLSFAVQIGKPDAEEYVDSGNWKARQGGNGVEMAQRSVVSFTPCVTEENTFHYELQRPIEKEFYGLFQPFGKLDFEMGNVRLGEVYVLNEKEEIVLKLQGRIGSKKLKVSIYKNNIAGARNLKGAEEKIKCQLTKYQMCMGCLACEGVCRQDAITIREKDRRIFYQISDQKCVRCGKCVGHFVGGCYMRKVLAIRRT